MTSFIVALAAFLAVFNNLSNWRPWPGWTYVPINIAVAAVLLVVARTRGLGWDELGLDRDVMWRGVRYGTLIAALIVLGLALAFVIPGAQRFLADRRVAGLDAAGLAYTALIRIPLGTVLLEEIAFRGVLYGAWLRIASPTAALIGSSVIFGLWHVVPTLELLRTNSFGGSVVVKSAYVGLGVIGTAIGGAALVGLREWTGGIAAPIIVHTAANSLATVAAYVWQRT